MIPGLCSAFYSRPGVPVGSFSAITDSTFQEAFGNGSQTTGPITAIAVGGTAPYTYAWTIDGSPTLTSPTTAATASSTFVGVDDFVSAGAQCTITDSASKTATTPQVIFAFQYEP